MEPESMRLGDFVEDSLARTGGQIRASTKREYNDAMQHFMKVVGNIDFKKVSLKHGELFRQSCLEPG